MLFLLFIACGTNFPYPTQVRELFNGRADDVEPRIEAELHGCVQPGTPTPEPQVRSS